MNEKLPISCFIIALNEADRIDKTIKSVKDLVDEVIVIDSRTTKLPIHSALTWLQFEKEKIAIERKSIKKSF